MRILKVVGIVFACTVVVGWFCAMASLGMANQDEWYYDNGGTGQGLEPCTDDSAPNYPCSWDSTTQGNGEGESFWVDENGVTHTWEDA